LTLGVVDEVVAAWDEEGVVVRMARMVDGRAFWRRRFRLVEM